MLNTAVIRQSVFSLRDPLPIADTAELGVLGVPHLKRIWSAAMAARNGQSIDRIDEADWDKTVLSALGLGLHQAMQYLFAMAPSFPEFENWIVTTAGEPDELSVERLQTTVTGQQYSPNVLEWLKSIENLPAVLSDDDLAFWDDHGFVVLEDAVSTQDCHDAEVAIWDCIGANPDAPDSWYQCRAVHGIMVELIQDRALDANRRSTRIQKAFSQLWGTEDLWVTADRCSFHPPQRSNFPFPGPDLHWDIDFARPLEFATQGILYLADTPSEQGALTLVPGFHKELPAWLSRLPENSDPQQQDLHALGSQPIGGRAGDMVIWNQLLPHGSRPNLGQQPRIAQYINLLPSGFPERASNPKCSFD